MKQLFQIVICSIVAFVLLGAKPIFFSPSQTNTQLLSSKDWVIYDAIVFPAFVDTASGDTISDLLEIADACHHDDTLLFNSDGTHEFDNGPSKCDSTENQILNFDWFFTTEEDTLGIIRFEDDTLKTFPDTSYLSILTLTEDTLRVGVTQRIDTNIRVNIVTYIAN